MRLILILFLSVALSNYSFSQCESSIELVKIYTASSSQKGSIEVLVKTNKVFELKLVLIDGIERITLEEHSGTGETKFLFEELSDEFLYRIYVQFDEDEFLCSNKIIDNIILKED